MVPNPEDHRSLRPEILTKPPGLPGDAAWVERVAAFGSGNFMLMHEQLQPTACLGLLLPCPNPNVNRKNGENMHCGLAKQASSAKA